MRENAADELGELEAVEALPDLYPLLEDSHPHVRQAAETAIETLEAISEEADNEADESFIQFQLPALVPVPPLQPRLVGAT